MKRVCVGTQLSLVSLDTEVENLRAAIDKALVARKQLRRALFVEDRKIQHLRKDLRRDKRAMRRANVCEG